MKRELIAMLAVELLVGPMAAQADIIFDTGEPFSELFNSGRNFRAGQFTVGSAFVINGIEQYIRVTGGGTVTFALRADDAGLPGAEMFSGETALIAADEGWQGIGGLNWNANAGTYWVTMELRSGQTASFARRLGFFEDGTAPADPLPAEALLPQFSDTWVPAGGRTGWRILGTVAAPTELIAELIQDVLNLNIEAGIGNALDSKLQNALDALDRAQDGDAASAVGILHAFIQSVEAQRGKKLTEEQADELVAAAQAIIDALSQQ